MQKNNSYEFDQFKDRTKEADRLDVRAKADTADFLPILVEAGLKPEMRILDVGAGTGIRALTLAKFALDGLVVGVDVSNELLKRARTLRADSAQKNLSFEHANVLSKESLKCLGKFDFIYSRLVFQHIPRPISAAKNLKSLLRPNGILFLEDADRDWLAIFPTPKNWKRLYKKIKEGQEQQGGDPRCGRKLGYFLAKAGFSDVNVRMIAVSGTNAKVEDWARHYGPSHLNFIDAALRTTGEQMLLDISEKAKTQPTFFYQVLFQAYGKYIE